MEQNVAPDDDWAALIINQVVNAGGKVTGYILVMNPDRPNAKWKFAGGHKEPGETPLETALRENQGETGLRLHPEAYTELKDMLEWRRNHWAILFLAKVTSDQVRLVHEHDIGNEGEIVRYFTLAELEVEIRNGTILAPHLRKFNQAVQLAA